MNCATCKEPLVLHQIMRQVIDPLVWHNVTEGRIKPSDTLPLPPELPKPRRDAEPITEELGVISLTSD